PRSTGGLRPRQLTLDRCGSLVGGRGDAGRRRQRGPSGLHGRSRAATAIDDRSTEPLGGAEKLAWFCTVRWYRGRRLELDAEHPWERHVQRLTHDPRTG